MVAENSFLQQNYYFVAGLDDVHLKSSHFNPSIDALDKLQLFFSRKWSSVSLHGQTDTASEDQEGNPRKCLLHCQ